jgi:spore maturation protein CgeB
MPTSRERVLFIGNDWYGSNATSLRNAIVRRGHECLTLDATGVHRGRMIRRRLGLTPSAPSAVTAWNRRIIAALEAWRPDVVLVFSGMAVESKTLAHTSAVRVHYHPDDTANPENISPIYATAEKIYDLHVTTKSFNVDELRQRGASNVLYVPCAYDRDWHLPIQSNTKGKYQLGFIGTRRPDRHKLICQLASEWQKKFLLCGRGWRRYPRIRASATVQGAQYGVSLSEAVAAAPLQLGLLNSANRDQHTCRSYEIPAAGGVLVAERTQEHMLMLEEGTEALYFSSEAELLEHVSRLTSDPIKMRHMRAAASRRIRGGTNTYEDRWDVIHEAIAGAR